ncbi:MAG: hypothetical protein RIR70_1249 [Pseudomonadota bacterium]|jgi:hypothetical protein
MKTKLALWVLWPSFLAAGLAEIAVFSILDPAELVVFGHHVEASREAIYSLGFFMLWAICALSSALTLSVLPGGPAEWAQKTQDGALD